MTDTGGAADAYEVLVTSVELEEGVARLAGEVASRYRDADEPPVLVGVLKGSMFFLADLVRGMGIDVVVDFMAISAYEGGAPGVVRIVADLDADIAGRDVVVVEDIVDTGLTLNYLRRTLEERAPRSLVTVTLLDKLARRIVPVPLEHRGFEIPDVFVVGYGLDFQGLYRNVSAILAVRDLPRLVNDPRLLVGDLFPHAQGR